MQNLNSINEIGELFWLFNELAKFNSSSLVPIVFNNISNVNNNNNNDLSI